MHLFPLFRLLPSDNECQFGIREIRGEIGFSGGVSVSFGIGLLVQEQNNEPDD